MKKIAVLVIALLATLAVSSVAATAANKTVVPTKISIKFKSGSGDYYEQASFSGKVKPKTDSNNLKKRCAQKRKVKIVNNDTGDVVGKGVTGKGKGGKYTTGVDASFVPNDDYIAKVKQKKFTKGKGKEGKHKVVCKKATSKVITAG